MKKTKTVKIKIDEKTEKEFTVKELTVAQIIDLSQNNPLFGATLNDKNKTTGKTQKKVPEKEEQGGFLASAVGYSESAQACMKLCCDFDIKDLKPLAPSDIKEIFDAFKEVNSTFLSLLDQMGIIKATKGILDRALSDFSRMLAI
jgi:hypothetical protein